MIGTHRWETVEVIIALIGLISVIVGLMVIASRPGIKRNDERIEEQKKQYEMFNKLDKTLTETNAHLANLIKSDDRQNARLDNHEGRIGLTEQEIAILKENRKSYIKDRRD